jgi:hypothetical protein
MPPLLPGGREPGCGSPASPADPAGRTFPTAAVEVVTVQLLDVAGVLLVAAALALAGLAMRRFLLRRGGAIDVSLRLRQASHGRGWALGLGRYQDDALAWYRAFSFSPRPRRTFPRTGLSVQRERRPTGPEALAVQAGSVVLDCLSSGARVELAMSESALTGLRAWLEAAPRSPPR